MSQRQYVQYNNSMYNNNSSDIEISLLFSCQFL